MKNKKKLIIFMFMQLIFYSFFYATDNSIEIRSITIKEFESDYGNKQNIIKQINKIAQNEYIDIPLESVKLYELKDKDIGYIVICKIIIGNMPFTQIYTVEFYYDKDKTYIKSNIVNYNNISLDNMHYSIEINNDNIGTNCEFD